MNGADWGTAKKMKKSQHSGKGQENVGKENESTELSEIKKIATYLESKETLMISTYHSGEVWIIKKYSEGDTAHIKLKRKLPSGISANRDGIYVATEDCIEYYSRSSLKKALLTGKHQKESSEGEAGIKFDRKIKTGKVLCHEIQSRSNAVYYINTRYSIISKDDNEKKNSFFWSPPFISEIKPHDYCHLNGFAFEGDEPRYATCLAGTNFDRGWRLFPYSSGIIIDIKKNAIIKTNLILPHSPRIVKDNLFVLESGKATLTCISLETFHSKTLVDLPGFARGMAMNKKHAFIGLSSIRNSNLWNELPVRKKHKDKNAKLAIIELENMQIIETIELQNGQEEIFDIQILDCNNS